MIDPILERAINLFTPDEWRSVIWLLLRTLALTHTLKVLWRLSPVRGGGDGGVQLIAIASGFIAAFLLWPEASGPWYVAGIIAGPASSLAFKATFAALSKFSPGIAAALHLWQKPEQVVETPAAEAVQKDGSRVLERTATTPKARPAHALPKGGKEERKISVDVQPERADCPLCKVDLTLVRMPDDS